MKTNHYKKQKNAGFSLMEILIALVVLGVGLLGIAALQAVSLKSNHGAYQQTQATFLAYDMMDRMRANRVAALAESYDITMAASSLSGTSLASTDVNDWLTNYVPVYLPNGDASIDCTAAGVCTIVIQWDASRQGGTAVDSSVTTQTFTYSAEI